MKRRFALVAVLVLLGFAARAGWAQVFDLSWNTIDNGGATFSTGGVFELGGTLAQPDAGPPGGAMTGGSFSLVGGFWPGSAAGCACPGDMNGDALKNGLDVQQFARCVVSGGACSCADVDGMPGVNMGDVAAFVSDLLAGAACP